MRVAVYVHVAASLATCDQCDLCFRDRVCLSLDLLCPGTCGRVHWRVQRLRAPAAWVPREA